MIPLRHSRLMAAAAFVAVCRVSAPAYAQGPASPAPVPERPNQQVYRGNRPDTQSRQSLLMTAGIWGVYDSHIVGSDMIGAAPADPDLQGSGMYPTAQAGLSYNRRGNRATFGSDVEATFTYHPNLRSTVQQPVDAYFGGAHVVAPLGRTELRLAQSVGYQPYLVIQPLPSVPSTFESFNGFRPGLLLIGQPGLTSEAAILDNPAVVYGSTASFMAPLTRRSSITFSYGLQGSNYSGNFADSRSDSAGVRVAHATGRSTDVHGSYTHTTTVYRRELLGRSDITTDGLDAGISHTRRLSPTRRLQLSFDAGASTLTGEIGTTDSSGERHEGTARAALDLELGRSWSTSAEFTRSLQLLQGLAQSYFGNAATFGAHGGLSRRLELATSVSYSQGAIGIDAAARHYDRRNASVRLLYALSGHVALSGEYINSGYGFGRGAILPLGVVSELNRHTVRVGLTWGQSFLGRSARP